MFFDSQALADWVESEIKHHGERNFIRLMGERTGLKITQSSLKAWRSGRCTRISPKSKEAIAIWRGWTPAQVTEWLHSSSTELPSNPVDEAIALINRGFALLKEYANLGINSPVAGYLKSDSQKDLEKENMARSLVAALIAELIESKRLAFKKIVRLSGIPSYRLQEILDKKINPTDEELAGLAKALDSQNLRIDYAFLKRLKDQTAQKDYCSCETDESSV